MGEGGLMQMKMKRILCALLLVGLLASLMAAHADQLERVWMEYEDYSGVRSEQAVEDAKTLEELEKILQMIQDLVGQIAQLLSSQTDTTAEIAMQMGQMA